MGIFPLYNTFVSILFIGVMNLKRMMGVVSTALLTGTMLFGVSHTSAYADTSSQPYQVVTPGEGNDKTTIVGFDNKIEFESYVKEHPIAPNFSKALQSSSQIYSTFYHDINLKGAQFNVNAGRNPVILTNFNAASNDKVSSVRTHKFGNYTTIYEHSNAQGRALAIANNGNYLNLTDYSMGDGARTWNDQASSAIVKSN
ncbi:hypothetical protein [Bacillus wiedmannii]|uniref:hypothetical protein n=1 Tax=Bacillus wiedmannii TaxID=1890302 RepID=UPI001CC21B2E|nr:hypothetical protein [Bacillus wiedmannii]